MPKEKAPQEEAPREEQPERSPLAKYLRYTNVGFQFFLAIALGTGAGIWLDGRFGTGVIFTLLGLAIGFGGGFYGLYRELFAQDPDDGKGSSGGGSPKGQSPEDRSSGGKGVSRHPHGPAESGGDQNTPAGKNEK